MACGVEDSATQTGVSRRDGGGCHAVTATPDSAWTASAVVVISAEQAQRGDGGVVRAGVGGAARVGHDDGAVAQVGSLPGGALDRGVGGDAGEQEGVDAAGAQDDVQLAGREPADPLVREDDVAVLRGELRDDLGLVAALDQCAELRDHAQQRRVGNQVRVAGLPGDAGVDDGGAGPAGGVEQLGGLADDVAFGGLGGEEAAEGTVGADDVMLHVDGDDRGARRGQVHDSSPVVSRCARRAQARARMAVPMSLTSRSAVKGLDRNTLTRSTPLSSMSWVCSRTSSGPPYMHQ